MTDDRYRDREEARARRAVEDALDRNGLSLDDASLWVEPAGGLEDSIVASIREQVAATPAAPRRRRGLLATAAALAGAAAVVVALVITRSPAPDWEVALFPTEAAPGASGVAYGWNQASGTRVELAVEGLEPAPAGYVYELWFSKEGIHISAGTFSTVDEVSLTVGVPRRDYPRVWITLEPIDRDPGPGTNILDSEIST
jgi:hypothetical protein